MSEDQKMRLFEAARTGTLGDVQAAFEACNPNDRKRYVYGELALNTAAGNEGPHALEMVKYLIKQRVKPDTDTLHYTAENPGPCALDIAKLLIEESVEPDSEAFCCAARNQGPHALEMVKLLMKAPEKQSSGLFLEYAAENPGPCALEIVQFFLDPANVSKWGVEPDFYTLECAAENEGPHALAIAKLLIEKNANQHEKSCFGDTAFTKALRCGNFAVADYLFSRDDFRLGDLMPRPKKFPIDTYETYREKAIARVSKLIDAKGLPYAWTVTADIEKILKNSGRDLKPTRDDIDVLRSLTAKIASKDWVGDAKVKSDDFLGLGMAR